MAAFDNGDGYERPERIDTDLKQKIAALEAECEGLRKDAERYRWLKEQGIVKAHVMTSLFNGDTRILAELYGGNTYVIKGAVSGIDAAIDSARGAKDSDRGGG